jgi:hypothetical protein
MDAILWIALCSNIADFGSSRRSNSSLLLSFTRVTIRPRRHSKLPGGQYLPVSLHLVVTVSHLSTVRRTCISNAMSTYVSRPTSLRNPHNSSRACRSKRDHCLDGSSMSSITVSTPSRRSMRSFCRLDVVSSSARLGRKAYKLAYTSNLILRIIDIQAYLQELVQGLDYVFRVQRAYIYRRRTKHKTQHLRRAASLATFFLEDSRKSFVIWIAIPLIASATARQQLSPSVLLPFASLWYPSHSRQVHGS